ncbi:MAG: DUF2079 domain-containing protein [Clostridia bacterium]|nr:DUF2079 domain-containing protein [Clostridia bacterium]
MKKRRFGTLLGSVFARLVSSWFCGTALTLIVFPGDASYVEYSIENLRFTVIAAICAFFVFSAADVFFARGRLKAPPDFWALFGSVFALACVSSYKFMSIFFAVGCFSAVVAVFFLCFSENRLMLREPRIGKKSSLLIIGGTAAIVFGFVCAVCLVRYRAYYAPTYDFGIFANLFENMLSTGLPNTTCERDGLLSHFAVHISPVFYLILPLYALCPRPETLLVIQTAAVVSGCIPVWLLARKKLGSYAGAVVFGLVYLLYPAFACGAFFDFHENKLLAPLILWALWFAEEKKRLPMYLFLLLTLTVKEDAPVYTAVIGAYLFFGKKERLHGGAIIIGSVAYFCGAVALLARIGEGAQLWRYDNIASGSLTSIIGAIIINPMRVVSECVGEEKIKFIFQMLFPLLGLPLVCKKPARFFLLIPFLLVNLMPDYVYQHDIGYQYTYGSGALLVFLAIVNWEDIREVIAPKTWKVCAGAVICATMLSFMSTGARGGMYFKMAKNESHFIHSIDDALAQIPEDAEVSASTMFVAHLADRPVIYDFDDNSRLADYVAIDLRGKSTEETELQRVSLEALGYKVNVFYPGAVAVYKADAGVVN